jgi:lipopolysaccharide transport system permease protein
MSMTALTASRKLIGSAKANSISVLAMFDVLWRYRELFWQLTKRDVVGRYRGSMIGLLWSLLNPLVMLSVYTFIFSVVFQSRWGQTGDNSTNQFALLLFIGMIIHSLFAECINRAPTLIVSNATYVKKVVFPLEILPWVAMGSALFHIAVSALVLVIFFGLTQWYLNWTIILFPVVLFPLVLFTMGLSWFFASAGVFFRDIAQTIGIFTAMLLFLAPVFYPASALPESYRPFLYLNPLTFIIEEERNVVIWGGLPNWVGLFIYTAVSLCVAWLGFVWFEKTRRGFADVL